MTRNLGNGVIHAGPSPRALPAQFTTAAGPELPQPSAERSAPLSEDVLEASRLLPARNLQHFYTHAQGLPSRLLILELRVEFWLVPCLGPPEHACEVRALASTRSSPVTVGAAHGPDSRGISTSATSSSLTSTHSPPHLRVRPPLSPLAPLPIVPIYPFSPTPLPFHIFLLSTPLVPCPVRCTISLVCHPRFPHRHTSIKSACIIHLTRRLPCPHALIAHHGSACASVSRACSSYDHSVPVTVVL